MRTKNKCSWGLPMSSNKYQFSFGHRVKPSRFTVLAAILLFSYAAGCRQSEPAAPQVSPSAPNAALQQGNATADASAKQAQPERGAVKAEFRNVMFHLTPTAAAHLEAVSGELWPVGKFDMPVFDDKSSFEVHVSYGTVSIAPDALAAIMNDYVFVRQDAPMKDISIEIKEDRLVIKGKLHSKGDLPFETGGDLAVNADGRLRIHSEKVKAAKLPVKKVMALFGIELADVINTSKIPGMDTDKNDLIFDLGDLLPPPHIRGKISAARLERNLITVVYGNGAGTGAVLAAGARSNGAGTDSGAAGGARSNGGGAANTPPDGARKNGAKPSANATTAGSDARDASLRGNYMLFRGNKVKFGKLIMENTDLAVIDLDAKDPLDWDQESYKEQLVEGYSKTTEQFGLRVYVKDFGKLAKPAKNATGRKEKNGDQ